MSLSSIISRKLWLRLSLTLLVAVCSAVSQFTTVAEVISVDSVKEWQARLAGATTPDDSIVALYNLFDITLRSDAGVYSDPLIALAERNKDYDVELDILRKVSNTFNGRDTAKMDSLLNIARAIPPSDDQRETVIFIEMRSLLGRLDLMDEPERVDMLHKFINEYHDDDEAGLYDRILSLYKLTMTLGLTVGGDLYSDYMDRLHLLIKELPDSIGPLSSLFHTQASMIYTINNENDKAIEANRKLLGIIDTLKAKNSRRGFIHFNYDRTEYVALRRLLACFETLSRDEIERYNARLLELAAANPAIADEYNSMRRSESFYLYGTGRYAEAIPVLRHAVAQPGNANYRPKLYHMLISCAEKTGNQAVGAEARNGYISALEERLEQSKLDKIRELQILLDANTASREHLQVVREEYEDSMFAYRIGIAAAALIALAAIALLFFSRRRQ